MNSDRKKIEALLINLIQQNAINCVRIQKHKDTPEEALRNTKQDIAEATTKLLDIVREAKIAENEFISNELTKDSKIPVRVHDVLNKRLAELTEKSGI